MQTEKKTFSIPSADGAHTLQAVTWLPEGGGCRAMVLVAHGMAEHFGRYEDFARLMAKQGIGISGHDHLGHKSTVSDDSELGYFAPENGWKLAIDDLKAHLMALKEQYPKTPLFLLGHSMGSFMARCLLAYHGELLDGAVIVGTGGPNPALQGGKLAASAFCAAGKGKKPNSFLNKLAFGGYNRGLEGRTAFDWLTRDQKIVDRYVADKYSGFLFTASGFRDLFSVYAEANRVETFRKTPQSLPLLLLSGGEDPVGNYGEGVKKVEQYYKDTGHIDLTLRLYPGARHEILNETNRIEVCEGLAAWILSRAGAGKK